MRTLVGHLELGLGMLAGNTTVIALSLKNASYLCNALTSLLRSPDIFSHSLHSWLD